MARDDNQSKAEHGRNRANDMKKRLESEMDRGVISGFTSKKRFGRDGYQEDQFYAPFEVEFADGTKWEIFATTTFKDRYKENEWDAWNIKEIDSDVEYCYLVLSNDPDSAKRENRKRKNKEIFSALDGVITEDEFYRLLEEKSELSRGLSKGQIDDARGRKFESDLVVILESTSNLKRWKGDDLQVGHSYKLYTIILEGLSLEPSAVSSIAATSNIPLLPSGGNPKTDVSLVASLADGKEKRATISCKRSKKDWVSVHQYKADDFIDVLGIKENRLARFIKDFQDVGGIRAFTKQYGQEATDLFTEMMSQYNTRLIRWVMSGQGGEGTVEQCASHVLIFGDHGDGSSYKFFTIDDYVRLVEQVKGQFGTSFKWTFASGQKGKSIQLKGLIDL